jgi:hypothetical protein
MPAQPEHPTRGEPVNTIVLHHYPASPFAEKARLMLGYKLSLIHI